MSAATVDADNARAAEVLRRLRREAAGWAVFASDMYVSSNSYTGDWARGITYGLLEAIGYLNGAVLPKAADKSRFMVGLALLVGQFARPAVPAEAVPA